VGLAQDLSSFNNVGTDEALLALRSGLLGEAEPLRKFGVNLSQTRIEAEAFALGLAKPVKNAAAITAAHNAVAAATRRSPKVEKEHGKGTLAAAQAQDGLARANANLAKAMAGQKVELTAAQKAQAAYSIILKDTKTAQGDAARTSGGYANQTRILHKNISDLEAQIGQKLLPHALRLTTAFSKLIVEFENGSGAGGRLREDLSQARWTRRSPPQTHSSRSSVSPAGSSSTPTRSRLRPSRHGRLRHSLPSRRSGTPASPDLTPSVAAVATGMEGVAAAGAGAAEGVTAVGAASALALPEIIGIAAALAGAYAVFKNFAGLVQQFKDDNSSNEVGTYRKQHAADYGDPTGNDTVMRGGFVVHETGTDQFPDDHDVKAGRGKTAVAASRAADASKRPLRQKAATDKAAAAQKYAADQAQAAAKRKAEAADALQKATDKLRDALQSRLDTAKGIRDSLISATASCVRVCRGRRRICCPGSR
jgi:hypothetical protein